MSANRHKVRIFNLDARSKMIVLTTTCKIKYHIIKDGSKPVYLGIVYTLEACQKTEYDREQHHEH